MSDSDKVNSQDGKQSVQVNMSGNCGTDGCQDSCGSQADATNRSASSDQYKSMEDCMGRSMDQLSRTFAASARRWEMIVYPSMFAFILLAAYGFFLVYSLTSDVSRVADSMAKITSSMQQVTVNMDKVTQNMVLMTQTVDTQSSSMHEIVLSMRGLNHSISRINYDIAVMNNSVSRPMSFMNSFMPW